MADPLTGLKSLLVAAAVGVDNVSADWGIHLSRTPNVPDKVIGLMNTGGTEPNPKYNIDYPSVQVMVRGAKAAAYTESRTKAQAVKDVLLGLPSQTIAGDRFTSVRMIGDIIDLGVDENDRHMHSVNFTLIIEPGSTGNRLTG